MRKGRWGRYGRAILETKEKAARSDIGCVGGGEGIDGGDDVGGGREGDSEHESTEDER